MVDWHRRRRTRWVLAILACLAVSVRIAASDEDVDVETTTEGTTLASTTVIDETTTEFTESPETPAPARSPVDIAITQVANVTNKLLPGLFYVAESSSNSNRGNIVVSPLAAATTFAMLLELEDAEGSSSGAAAAQDLRRALRLPKNDIGAGPSLRLGFQTILGLSRAAETREDVAGAFASAILRSGVNGELPTKASESLREFFWANVTKETRSRGRDSLELSVDAGVLSHWRDLHLVPVYVVLSHRASAPFQRGPDAGGEVLVPMVPLVGEYRLGVAKIDGFACKIVEIPLEAPGTTLVLLLPPPELAVPDAALVAAAGQKLPEMLASLPIIGAEVLLPQLAVVSRQLDLRPLLPLLGARVIPPTLRLRQDAFLAASFSALNAVNSVTVDLGESSAESTGQKPSLRRRKRKARLRRQSLPRLVLDRPFLFFVLLDSQVMLLAGRVRDPAQKP